MVNSNTTWMKFPIWITGAPAFFSASRLAQHVPCTHEPAAAFADEIVKHPAALPEGINDLARQFDEDGIRLTREKDFHFGQIADDLLQVFGHGIGVASVTQPCAILQHANPGSGQ